MPGDLRARQFRQVCGRFATGVTVILTKAEDGHIHGMTANAFMSVSLEPLLVAVAVHRRGRMAQLMSRPGCAFTLSVLSHQQQHVAESYAHSDRLPDPEHWYWPHPGQPPVIGAAQAWMRCRVDQITEAGDHLLVVSQALEFQADSGQLPLVFYGGRYWEYLERQGDWADDWLLLER